MIAPMGEGHPGALQAESTGIGLVDTFCGACVARKTNPGAHPGEPCSAPLLSSVVFSLWGGSRGRQPGEASRMPSEPKYTYLWPRSGLSRLLGHSTAHLGRRQRDASPGGHFPGNARPKAGRVPAFRALRSHARALGVDVHQASGAPFDLLQEVGYNLRHYYYPLIGAKDKPQHLGGV